MAKLKWIPKNKRTQQLLLTDIKILDIICCGCGCGCSKLQWKIGLKLFAEASGDDPNIPAIFPKPCRYAIIIVVACCHVFFFVKRETACMHTPTANDACIHSIELEKIFRPLLLLGPKKYAGRLVTVNVPKPDKNKPISEQPNKVTSDCPINEQESISNSVLQLCSFFFVQDPNNLNNWKVEYKSTPKITGLECVCVLSHFIERVEETRMLFLLVHVGETGLVWIDT